MRKALLYDSTLCVGCKLCEAACADRWGLPFNEEIEAQDYLSDHKLTVVQESDDGYVRRLCMHCGDPTCASVCPVGAFQKTSLGPVVYDEDRCIGCRYCMMACPFQVPVYEWAKLLPRVRKCDMCHERQASGDVTACAEICPTAATLSGEYDELVAEARRRIRENPDQYFERIYGQEEVGGTSVLMIAAVPLEQLGMPGNLPQHPLPMLTWRALTHVPDVVAVGSVLLGGVWWITHRREEVTAAERTSRVSTERSES